MRCSNWGLRDVADEYWKTKCEKMIWVQIKWYCKLTSCCTCMSQPKHRKILIEPYRHNKYYIPYWYHCLCIAGMCQTIYGERSVIGTLGNDFKCWYANIFLLYYIIITSKLCIQTENQEKHETLTLKQWLLPYILIKNIGY